MLRLHCPDFQTFGQLKFRNVFQRWPQHEIDIERVYTLNAPTWR